MASMGRAILPRQPNLTARLRSKRWLALAIVIEAAILVTLLFFTARLFG